MADFMTPEQRSKAMSRVRGKNTKPEKIIRSLLHQLGYRFRINRKDLPGKPDIVLKKYQAIIFIHGCFWHSHQGCKKSKLPDTNTSFWKKKIERNVLRDQKNIEILQKDHWRIAIVWECGTKSQGNLDNTMKKITLWLNSSSVSLVIPEN